MLYFACVAIWPSVFPCDISNKCVASASLSIAVSWLPQFTFSAAASFCHLHGCPMVMALNADCCQYPIHLRSIYLSIYLAHVPIWPSVSIFHCLPISFITVPYVISVVAPWLYLYIRYISCFRRSLCCGLVGEF